jgi:assimilatory nitrate reductase catalytic subunit
MGRAKAAARAQIVCTCENVSDLDLRTAIMAGRDLQQLQAALKCGTACGSCLPQIRRMISRHRDPARRPA